MLAIDQLKPSQRQVFDAMCDASTNTVSTCCIVQAFGGCGKTKLLAMIAQERFERGFGCSLLLTFSKNLKESLRANAKKQEGLVVENVHSLIRNVLYRGHNCVNEKDIEHYLQLETKPALHPDFYQHVNFVIFDEMQDMTPTFHKVVELVRSLLAPKVVSFLGVGDFFQAENAHIGSTPEFMTNARAWFAHERYMEFGSPGSFRLGNGMCAWINRNLDPRSLQKHFPACWAKYGERILKYWENGMFSHKCKTCDTLHEESAECKQQRNPSSLLHVVRLVRNIPPPRNKRAPPLPVEADKFVKQNNAVIFLNGRRKELYSQHYQKVTNPFQFKGCETECGVVVGFDHFTERLCAKNATAESGDADWPFTLYCQMLVSFTRVSEQVIAIVGDDVPFFTMRNTVIVPKPLVSATKAKHDDNNNGCGVDVLRRKVPRIAVDVVFAEMDLPTIEKMRKQIDVTTTNDGEAMEMLSQWILSDDEQRHFDNVPYTMQDFCKHLVLTAVRDARHTGNALPPDWVEHIAVQTKIRFATTERCADATLAMWCAKRARAMYALVSRFDLSENFGVHEPFVFGMIKGTIDIFTRFGCVFVTFEPNTDRTLLQHMTSFLCCKYRAMQLATDNHARSHLFSSCHVVNLCNFKTCELTLNVHADFFLSQLRSKQVDHLFDQTRFSDIALLVNKVPILI